MTKSSWDKAEGRAAGYDVVTPGYNYRTTELASALGLIQLKKLPAANARRRELVALYRRRLCGLPGLTIPFADRIDDSAHHIFAVLLTDAAERDRVRQRLTEAGIQTSHHYPPVHQFSHYRARCPDSRNLDRTEAASPRELTLPLHPLLSDADIHAICDTFEQALRRYL
jgi:dTDP-4-amino-4,6-dideoxygalactose transaminase